jgi:hypothetical protein
MHNSPFSKIWRAVRPMILRKNCLHDKKHFGSLKTIKTKSTTANKVLPKLWVKCPKYSPE